LDEGHLSVFIASPAGLLQLEITHDAFLLVGLRDTDQRAFEAPKPEMECHQSPGSKLDTFLLA
jgi:hypothetical protein